MSVDATAVSTPIRELISFSIAEQDFCMDITLVREIRGWTEVTPLPHAARDVLGVMNLRGAVVPIVDLSVRLNLGPCPHHARNVIIIALIGTQTLGFLVNTVSDIVSVPTSDIQPMPSVGGPAAGTFVEGIISSQNRTLRVVNAVALGAILNVARVGA